MNRRPRVVVIGLGPAGPELITAASSAHWNNASAGTRFTRTDRHPSVAVLGSHRSFDDHYERATNLVEVYPAIVDTLVGQARAAGQVVYAVPGSPLVAERTVELLRGDKRVDVVIEPALSFLDLAWARLGVDPLACGVRLVDGHRFASEAAGERGPLLVAQCDHRDVLSDVKLSIDPWPKEPAVVLARLGLPDESVTVVAWEDLDRVVEADHLTSLWIPSLTAPVGSELVALAEVVGRLRRECPWDRAQTHHSLARYVLEEAYEVVETLDNLDLDSGDGAEDLADELGDLLFQVYLHSEMAAQAGWFTLADVARGIHDKMLRRHPHVFAPEASSMPGVATMGEPGSSDALVLQWDDIKRAERAERGEGPLDGLARALPALAYASKLQKKVAALGLGSDFVFATGQDALASVRAGLDRLASPSSPLSSESERAHDIGGLLFAVCDVARHLGVDPEEALRHATADERRRLSAAGDPAEGP